MVKPAQVPHEKNGEQPLQSLPAGCLPLSSLAATLSPMHSLSVQQGLTDSKITHNENIKQSDFTRQNYQLKIILPG